MPKVLISIIVLYGFVFSAAGRTRAEFEFSPSSIAAGTSQWLHWAGPSYDFSVAGEPALATTWPKGGPRRVWTQPLGAGFSAVLAEHETVYSSFRRGEEEILAALDAKTGAVRWQRPFHTPDHPEWRMPTGSPVAGPGPYATPLVEGTRVFFATSLGVLHAVDKQNGTVLWTKNIWKDLQGSEVQPGYSSSPLAYKDQVIVCVGGPGRGLMSLRQEDGAVVWSSVDADNAFASPILIELSGRSQIVAFMRDAIVGVDPEGGQLLWRHGHATNYGIHASTPVWGPGNILFLSSAYDGGSRALRIDAANGRTQLTELWHTRRVRIHHSNAIRIANHVYASNGDFGPAPLTAVDVTTGAVEWQDRRFGKSTLIRAGNYVILLDESGRLALTTLSPEGLTVHAEADVLAATAWTVPTLVGDRLFVRNQREIAAFELPTTSLPAAARH